MSEINIRPATAEDLEIIVDFSASGQIEEID